MQNITNLEMLNLQDEEGNNYTCMVSPEDYNDVVGGDYELANKYLQKEIEKKNRLLACQLFKQEQNKFILGEKTNTYAEASCSKNVVKSTLHNQSDIDIDHETYEENIEYSGSITPSTSNELWPYNAIIALIASMAIHYDDLSHPKKKKYVFSNICNELLSKKLIYTEKACYNKWRSLLRSYKATKDKKMSTGQGATRFMFFDQMEEILGNKPSHSSGHTIESSEDAGSEGNNTLVPNSIEHEASTEEHLSGVSGVEDKTKKRKRKSTVDIKEAAKQKRHEERMEREDRKLDIEERKLALIERFIEKI